MQSFNDGNKPKLRLYPKKKDYQFNVPHHLCIKFFYHIHVQGLLQNVVVRRQAIYKYIIRLDTRSCFIHGMKY